MLKSYSFKYIGSNKIQYEYVFNLFCRTFCNSTTRKFLITQVAHVVFLSDSALLSIIVAINTFILTQGQAPDEKS